MFIRFPYLGTNNLMSQFVEDYAVMEQTIPVVLIDTKR